MKKVKTAYEKHVYADNPTQARQYFRNYARDKLKNKPTIVKVVKRQGGYGVQFVKGKRKPQRRSLFQIGGW